MRGMPPVLPRSTGLRPVGDDSAFHDHEGFYVLQHVKPFVIMLQIPPRGIGDAICDADGRCMTGRTAFVECRGSNLTPSSPRTVTRRHISGNVGCAGYAGRRGTEQRGTEQRGTEQRGTEQRGTERARRWQGGARSGRGAGGAGPGGRARRYRRATRRRRSGSALGEADLEAEVAQDPDEPERGERGADHDAADGDRGREEQEDLRRLNHQHDRHAHRGQEEDPGP